MGEPATTNGTRVIRVDKIGSVVANLKFQSHVEITPDCVAADGNVVVVRALQEKAIYNQLELYNGRTAKISRGDVILGALGVRRALRGFVGRVPRRLKAGDRLQILNLGGVIGRCTSASLEVGRPIDVEVLGMAVAQGRIRNLRDAALSPSAQISESKPLVLFTASSMNAGKTAAACELIQRLSGRGYKVAGAKLSGVACLRDTLNMQDHGAVKTASFLDCGLASTAGMKDLSGLCWTLLTHLNREPNLDAIIVELGDGILGDYGVASVLTNLRVQSFTKILIYCATDLAAVWGGVEVLKPYGLPLDCISGPATDNEVGLDFIRDRLGVPAINALTHPEKLADLVELKIFGKRSPTLELPEYVYSAEEAETPEAP